MIRSACSQTYNSTSTQSNTSFKSKSIPSQNTANTSHFTFTNSRYTPTTAQFSISDSQFTSTESQFNHPVNQDYNQLQNKVIIDVAVLCQEYTNIDKM